MNKNCYFSRWCCRFGNTNIVQIFMVKMTVKNIVVALPEKWLAFFFNLTFRWSPIRSTLILPTLIKEGIWNMRNKANSSHIYTRMNPILASHEERLLIKILSSKVWFAWCPIKIICSKLSCQWCRTIDEIAPNLWGKWSFKWILMVVK